MGKNILIFIHYFYPGFAGGGSTRSILNLANRLSDTFYINIITSDRDLDNKKPYDHIQKSNWLSIKNFNIFYNSPRLTSYYELIKICRRSKNQILYFNSLYSFNYTIIPLLLQRFKIIPKSSIIVAPRGALSPNAIRQDSLKNYFYLFFVKKLINQQEITWHATNAIELSFIKRLFGSQIKYFIASMLSNANDPESAITGVPKHPGSLKIIFLSRIAKIKNLIFVINILKSITGLIELDIVGSIIDRDYWKECLQIMKDVPKTIKISYKGPIEHADISETLRKYHLLFLPTLGENFGHVIYEAFSCSIPVLISNLTPWKNLEFKGAGWDIPLENEEKFISILQYMLTLNQDEYNLKTSNVSKYFRSIQSNTDEIEKIYRKVFEKL